jgi:hypothetical protein
MAAPESWTPPGHLSVRRYTSLSRGCFSFFLGQTLRSLPNLPNLPNLPMAFCRVLPSFAVSDEFPLLLGKFTCGGAE